MKRQALGGATRGPVDAGRQRRTIRFTQILLVLIAGALMMLAGYSFGRVQGYRLAQRDGFDKPRAPSTVQTVVLVVLGGIAIAAAASLGAGTVKLPQPARLEELAGRAEDVAIEQAERYADVESADKGSAEKAE